MKYKAVLFDLDGTLLDTLGDIADAANRVLSSRGFPIHSLEDHRAAIGNGARRLMERVLPESNRDALTVQECVEAFRRDYGEHWNIKTRPYPGVPELLDALQGRGIMMAVLSNKPAEITRNCVNGILSNWRFDPVIGARDGIPNKPDPTSAIGIAGELGIPTREFVYLGDTGVDMETAKAAGMLGVGALWGFRERAELLGGGAQYLLDHPTELLRILIDE